MHWCVVSQAAILENEPILFSQQGRVTIKNKYIRTHKQNKTLK